jgi:pilus assembly protein FimV
MGRKIAAVALSLGCLHAGSVMALGLGELKLESFLNEPLKAEVDLLNIGGLHADEIKVRLATREDFEKLGIERAYFLTGIKFEVVVDDDGTPRIVMTSDDPVLEPYLDFIVEARWPTGRLLREYTVLVDPPVFDQAGPVISATQRVEEVEGIPAPVKKTDEPAAVEETGTRVELRKSTLGPGEMPDRDFSADTSPTPMPGTRYMIHRDDTLWEIAQQARPGDTSVHQTMLDIQRLNPDAFIDGNINRIKAGYIVYLPSEGDISSDDLSAALAEVRQQNEDWRAGRASAPIAGTGPTLRISAEEPEVVDASEAGDVGAEVAPRDVAATGVSVDAEGALADTESAETAGKLAALEQQVETLNRIVTLKDEQIAALQAALAETQGETVAEPGDAAPAREAEPSAPETADEDTVAGEEPAEAMAAVDETALDDSQEAEVAPAQPESAQPVAAAARPEPQVQQPVPPAAESGMMNYLMYALGAAVIAILGFVFLRRRGQTDETGSEAPAAAPPASDVFADVKLKEQPLQVEAPAEEPEPAAEEAPEPAVAMRDNRGYGERKHDEYASDVDAGDALAEADIYIAYGRYPQAIDLLSNAVVNDPGNAEYRLKLLELYAETDNEQAARQQLEELQAIGDPDSITRGEAVLADMDKGEEVDESRRFIEPDAATEAVEDTPPAGLAEATGVSLESDFSGLEIEEPIAEEETPADRTCRRTSATRKWPSPKMKTW